MHGSRLSLTRGRILTAGLVACLGALTACSGGQPSAKDIQIVFEPNAEGFFSLEDCDTDRISLMCTLVPSQKAWGEGEYGIVAIPRQSFKATAFDSKGVKLSEMHIPLSDDVALGEKAREEFAWHHNGDAKTVKILRLR